MRQVPRPRLHAPRNQGVQAPSFRRLAPAHLASEASAPLGSIDEAAEELPGTPRPELTDIHIPIVGAPHTREGQRPQVFEKSHFVPPFSSSNTLHFT